MITFCLHRQWESLRLQTRRAGPLSCGHRCEQEDVFSPSVLVHLLQALYKYMVGTDSNMDIIAYHWLMIKTYFLSHLPQMRAWSTSVQLNTPPPTSTRSRQFIQTSKSKHWIIMTGLITFSKSFDSFLLLWQFWQPLLNNANNINNPADFVNTHVQTCPKKAIKYTRLITAQCTVSNGIPSSPVFSSGWRKSE